MGEAGGLEQGELTGRIIGAAIEVHRELGPGYIESVYEKALRIELGQRGIDYSAQLHVPVVYKGVEIHRHRLDLFVANEVVVELKVVRELSAEHFAVVRSYIRATGHQHGLLLNFAKPTLEVKRVFASRR
jgi:GxxExxY protein